MYFTELSELYFRQVKSAIKFTTIIKFIKFEFHNYAWSDLQKNKQKLKPKVVFSRTRMRSDV